MENERTVKGMAEYIDRQKAIDLFFPVDPENDGSDGTTLVCLPLNYSSADIESKLSDMPAADVATVRHGRWDIDEFGHYCTVCREYGPEIEGDAEIVDLLKYGTPYCPYCGAKMDLEEL